MQIIVKVFVAVCTNNMQAAVGLHCCFFFSLPVNKCLWAIKRRKIS